MCMLKGAIDHMGIQKKNGRLNAHPKSSTKNNKYMQNPDE
jgi:hypothetical protein